MSQVCRTVLAQAQRHQRGRGRARSEQRERGTRPAGPARGPPARTTTRSFAATLSATSGRGGSAFHRSRIGDEGVPSGGRRRSARPSGTARRSRPGCPGGPATSATVHSSAYDGGSPAVVEARGGRGHRSWAAQRRQPVGKVSHPVSSGVDRVSTPSLVPAPTAAPRGTPWVRGGARERNGRTPTQERSLPDNVQHSRPARRARRRERGEGRRGRHRRLGRARPGDRARLAAPGCDVAVLARGEDGLAGAVADVAATGRRGARDRHATSPTTAGRGRRRPGRGRSRPDRGLGERRDGERVRASSSKTDPSDFERATAVTYLGFVQRDAGGAAADDAARPRGDRPGRVGARVPRDPAAGGVLRREARDGRLHRERDHRAAARRAARCGVSMVHMPALNTIQFNWVKSRCRTTRSRCRRSTSPRSAPARSLHVAEHPRRTHLGRRCRPSPRSSATGRRPAARPLPRPDRVRRAAEPAGHRPEIGDNLYGRCPGTRARTGLRLQGARAQPADLDEPAPRIARPAWPRRPARPPTALLAHGRR